MKREELEKEIEKILEKDGVKVTKGNKKGFFVYIGNISNNKLSTYVIHIPHSSLEVPDDFYKKLNISIEEFEKENMFMCDYLVDKFIPNNFTNIVKFKYSRMYCDVERYLDDNKEKMSKVGMGAIYEKDSRGKNFINVNQEHKDYVICNYYKKHHKELDNMVEKVLNKYNKCFIIDLHSFSDKFVNKMFKKKHNPDICIGINEDNYDEKLLQLTINHFKKYGYTVKINYPYSGSIISNEHPEVKSIMIEINKRIYMKSSNQYNKFYNCMLDYYELLKKLII